MEYNNLFVRRYCFRDFKKEGPLEFFGNKLKVVSLLTYFPNQINLEISSYSFNGRIEPGIAEIGLFSTHLNKEGNLQTDLRVGNNFRYNSRYGANHGISKIIDKIQKSEVIPHISEDILENLSGYRFNK